MHIAYCVWLHFILDLCCEFRYFHENFIFEKSVKRHIYDAEHSRLGNDLPISVNDRVIVRFREGFIFTKLREVSRK